MMFQDLEYGFGYLESRDAVCDSCGGLLDASKLITWGHPVDLGDSMMYILWFPFQCPECHKYVLTIRVWKDLEISQELEAIK